MLKPQTKHTKPFCMARFRLFWKKCSAVWVGKMPNRIFVVWVGSHLKPLTPPNLVAYLDNNCCIFVL